jgi:hypothetical protein
VPKDTSPRLPAVSDREKDFLIALLAKYTKDWYWIAERQGWQIDTEYHREEWGGESRPGEHLTIGAEAWSSWRYLMATIKFFLPAIKDIVTDKSYPPEDRADRLEKLVLHEVCHVLVNEMAFDPTDKDKEGAYDHEERVVEMLARAIIAVEKRGYDLGYEDARKGKKKRGHLSTGAREIAGTDAGSWARPKRAGSEG